MLNFVNIQNSTEIRLILQQSPPNTNTNMHDRQRHICSTNTGTSLSVPSTGGDNEKSNELVQLYFTFPQVSTCPARFFVSLSPHELPPVQKKCESDVREENDSLRFR